MTNPSKPLLVLFALQIVLVVTLVFEFYKLLGLNFSFDSRTFFFMEPNPFHWVLFFAALVLVLLIQLFFIYRAPQVNSLQKSSSKTIRSRAKEKALAVKQPNVMALLILEFFFVIAIAVSIYLYLDPETNLVPFPFNLITFVVLVAIMLYLFSQTRAYRINSYEPKLVERKLAQKIHKRKGKRK